MKNREGYCRWQTLATGSFNAASNGRAIGEFVKRRQPALKQRLGNPQPIPNLRQRSENEGAEEKRVERNRDQL
jgi:hypothetical protein